MATLKKSGEEPPAPPQVKGTETAFISLCSESQYPWVNPDRPWHDCAPEPRGWWTRSSINREEGKGGWQLPKRCCKLPTRRSRRPEAAKRGVKPSTAGSPKAASSAARPGGTRGERCESRYRQLPAASGYLQPLWIISYEDISASIFHVPAGCPPASLLAIWRRGTRRSLWPSTDLLNLEASQPSWLPPLVPMAKPSVNSCTRLFPALRWILSFLIFFFLPPCRFPSFTRLSFHHFLRETLC